jgi:hypothetical protein
VDIVDGGLAWAKKMDIDLRTSALEALALVAEEHALAKMDPTSGNEEHLLPCWTNWFHPRAGTLESVDERVLTKNQRIAHESNSEEGGASRYQDTLATSVDPESLGPRLIGLTRVY